MLDNVIDFFPRHFVTTLDADTSAPCAQITSWLSIYGKKLNKPSAFLRQPATQIYQHIPHESVSAVIEGGHDAVQHGLNIIHGKKPSPSPFGMPINKSTHAFQNVLISDFQNGHALDVE